MLRSAGQEPILDGVAGGVGLAGRAGLGVGSAAADLRRLGMANDAYFAVSGYVATQPRIAWLKDGTCAVSMRIAWTPRARNKATGEWSDRQTSFASVTCYRRIAENAASCVRRGDPITLTGTLQVREYVDRAGAKRNSVEVVADSLGHDMSRGLSHYSKTPQHEEQTAREYERSTAAERNPLPGDVAAAGGAGDQVPGEPDPDDLAQQPDTESAPDDEPDDEPDLSGLDDQPEDADLASEQQEAELAGARA